MRNILTAIGLALALVLFISAGEAGEWEKLSEEERRQLENGEVIYRSVKTKVDKDKHKGHGVSMIVVNAPIEECWRIFTEWNKHQEFIPGKVGSAVIEEKPDYILCLKKFRFFGVRIQFTVRYYVDVEKRRVEFKLDPDWAHDIKDTYGHFAFEKITPDSTLFIYECANLDPGIVVPPKIMDFLQKRALPAVSENVKKRIETGGEWKKDENLLYQGLKDRQEPR
jgi:hypothetical protein